LNKQAQRSRVIKLDRLGRSTRELLDDPLWDTTSSQGRLLSTLLAVNAKFERELIRKRTGEAASVP